MATNLTERVKHLEKEMPSKFAMLKYAEDQIKATCSGCGTYSCDVCMMANYHNVFRDMLTPIEDYL